MPYPDAVARAQTQAETALDTRRNGLPASIGNANTFRETRNGTEGFPLPPYDGLPTLRLETPVWLTDGPSADWSLNGAWTASVGSVTPFGNTSARLTRDSSSVSGNENNSWNNPGDFSYDNAYTVGTVDPEYLLVRVPSGWSDASGFIIRTIFRQSYNSLQSRQRSFSLNNIGSAEPSAVALGYDGWWAVPAIDGGWTDFGTAPTSGVWDTVQFQFANSTLGFDIEIGGFFSRDLVSMAGNLIVSIQLDDGDLTQYNEAFLGDVIPDGVPATIFVIEEAPRTGRVQEPEILDMYNGGWEIGVHGATEWDGVAPAPTDLPTIQALIQDCSDWIEGITGEKPASAATPGGATKAITAQAVENVGLPILRVAGATQSDTPRSALLVPVTCGGNAPNGQGWYSARQSTYDSEDYKVAIDTAKALGQPINLTLHALPPSGATGSNINRDDAKEIIDYCIAQGAIFTTFSKLSVYGAIR
jgi:peptidoglycan/xylan/chitin deacetylase (PgdA/CDA1 family)